MSDSATNETKLHKWNVERRLEFIEFRLLWTGQFNRGELCRMFDVSPPQASNAISLYQKMAPENLDYDTGLKTYLRSENFKPRLIGNSVGRFLLQIVAVERGWLTKEDTWFEEMPPMEVVSLKKPLIDSQVLQGILDAIREHSEAEISYSSMTGSAAKKRVIIPHAMASAASRWYVRAWSQEHNDFRDYALSRISKVRILGPGQVDASNDLEWQHKMDLILVPNPEFDDARKRAQELEHQMIDGELRVECRLSMAFYLMAEHNLDVEPGVLKPFQQPLVMKNIEEIKQAREVTRQLAKKSLDQNRDNK